MAKDKSKKKTTKKAPKVEKAKAKKVKVVDQVPEVIEAPAKYADHPHLKHLDKVGKALAIVRNKDLPKKERKKAARFLDEARTATHDRAAAKAIADAVDRADAARVEAYNETIGRELGTYLTSDAEKAKADASLDAKPSPDDTDADRKARVKAKKAAREQSVKGVAAAVAETLGGKMPEPARPDEIDAPAEPERQEAEEVETESGREFAVGTPVEDAPTLSGPGGEVDDADFELNGIGQYKVWNPEKKAERGYTRVTTYIDCLEDKKRLEEWKMRQVLIGAGLDLEAAQGEAGNAIVTKATDLYNAWAKAYRKTAKREAKGELDLGQFGLLRAEADKALREGVNILAELALEYAGANEKRERGTDLHRLTEQFDRGELKLEDEAEWIEKGLATAADFADLRAYDTKMRELGIEHVYIEKRVVLDHLKVAGTLDRGSYYKLPGATRRTKLVADLKTGRVDYSAGKIGMQLGLYSQGEGYDRANPELREKLGLSKSVALLIHLPAGEATCNVYPVDLTLAAKGLKLAQEVRGWRNEGKKVYDLKTPLSVAS